MNSFKTTCLMVIFGTATILMSTSAAFAWGCQAAGSGDSYGYSYDYDNESDAIDRALDECNQRSDTPCEIVECDPDQ